MTLILIKVPIETDHGKLVINFDKEKYQNDNQVILNKNPVSYQIIGQELNLIYEATKMPDGNYSFL